jgi:ornithine carbamoyltransferase
MTVDLAESHSQKRERREKRHVKRRNVALIVEKVSSRTRSAMEVTDDVFGSPASVLFDQAGDRLHTTEAPIVAMIGN